jgi:hypothetical protein
LVGAEESRVPASIFGFAGPASSGFDEDGVDDEEHPAANIAKNSDIAARCDPARRTTRRFDA